MILAHMPLHDPSIPCQTKLPDQLSDPMAYFPGQYVIPVLRTQYQVVPNVVDWKPRRYSLMSGKVVLYPN